MKQILIGVIVALAGVFAAYYLNQKSADVRYDLSRPITLDNSNPKKVVIAQQIEIASSGNAVAQKLGIRIANQIKILSFIKDSQADKSEQFIDNLGATEIFYDELRPLGRIKFSFSSETALGNSDIDMKFQDGVASSDLIIGNRLLNTIPQINYWAAFAFFIYSGYAGLRQSLFSYKCTYAPVDVIKSSKPLFVKESAWLASLEDAASRLGKQKYFQRSEDMSSWDVFKLLNEKPPQNLPIDVWEKLLPNLRVAFTERVNLTAATSYVSGASKPLRKRFGSDKPALFPQEDWDELTRDLGKMYVSSFVLEAISYDWRWESTRKTCINGLMELKSTVNGLNDETRKRGFEWITAVYFANLANMLRESARWKDDLSDLNIDYLSSGQVSCLQEISYAKKALGENKERESELRKREAEINNLAKETEKVKSKVMRQLNIIDNFIRDPREISKIESYDDAFSPGNLENLRTLAELMIKKTVAP